MAQVIRVLVADDDPGVREQLAFALCEAGYHVDVASTAADARRRIQSCYYEVVIADWWLPDADGLVLANEASDRGAKTFVLTGYALTLLHRAAERHQLLRKPISPTTMVQVIEHSLPSILKARSSRRRGGRSKH